MQQDLVNRARRGDHEAFTRLAAARVDRLYAVARLVLRDPDLAYDAVQEALIRCWRQLPKLREAERFDGWLYRILVRAATDELGRKRRHEASVMSIRDDATTTDSESALADRDQLDHAFLRLSVEQRSVVVLHQYVGLPMSEVGQALGIPEGTAKSRYHYALAILRAALDADARSPKRAEVTA